MGVSIRPEQEDPLATLAKKHGVQSPQPPQASDPLTSLAQKHGAAPKSNLTGLITGEPVETETETTIPQTILASLANALTWGHGPQATAGIEALFSDKTYDEALESRKGLYEQSERDNPGTAITAEIVGSTIPAAFGAGMLPAAVTKGVGRVGAGALTGGVASGLYGIGNEEDTAEDAAWRAGLGAVLGGGAAAVAPYVAKGVGHVVDFFHARPKAAGAAPWATATAGGPSTGPMASEGASAFGGLGGAAGKAAGGTARGVSRAAGAATDRERALDEVLKNLRRDNRSLDELQLAAQTRSLNPKPEVLAEYGGENVGGLYEATATLPGRAKEAVSQLENRVGTRFGEQGMAARATADLERRTGIAAGSTREGVETITKRMRESASPLYDKAFQAGAVVDERIAPLLKRPSTRSAVKYAKDLAEEAGETFSLPDTGAPMDIRALHHIKLALDDAIAAAKLDTSKGPTMRARMIETRNQIREILHTNPDYRKAAEIWSGESAMRDALEEGSEAMTRAAKAEDIRHAMQNLTPGEQEMYRQGMVNRAIADLADVGDNRNPMAVLAGSPGKRDKIAATFSNKADFEAWLDDVQREDAIVGTRNTRLRGSQTASRLASQEDLGMPSLEVPAQAPSLWQLPVIAGQKALDAARRRSRESLGDELAGILTAGSNDPKDFQVLLQELVKREAAVRAAANRPTAGAKAGAITGIVRDR